MGTGAFTGYIDTAQIALYIFWVFFFGLIFYLRREDRREGYPLEKDTDGQLETVGALWMAEPKTFRLADGSEVQAPNDKRDSTRELRARRLAVWPGAPIEPTGNPMLDGVGPGGYALRADHPEMTHEGEPKIVPARLLPAFSVAPEDPDPRGMDVVGADGAVGGTVSEIWIDRAEHLIRYLEVDVPITDGMRKVLLPVTFTVTNRRKQQIAVNAILGSQFADVPMLANSDQVTMLEEEKICAYYGAGQLYATPQRVDPYF